MKEINAQFHVFAKFGDLVQVSVVLITLQKAHLANYEAPFHYEKTMRDFVFVFLATWSGLRIRMQPEPGVRIRIRIWFTKYMVGSGLQKYGRIRFTKTCSDPVYKIMVGSGSGLQIYSRIWIRFAKLWSVLDLVCKIQQDPDPAFPQRSDPGPG